MTKNLLKEVMTKASLQQIARSKLTDMTELVKAIESGYVAQNPSKTQQKKTFAPSTLTWGHGECPRYWYFAFDGGEFEETSNAWGIANRDSGTASHDRIQKAMFHAGILEAKEFKVISEDPPIFGYGDVMLNWEGKQLLGEIKTVSNDDFNGKKERGKPKKSHLMQLLIYMKILKKGEAVLIYENKNNHELLIFDIQLNDTYKGWAEYAFDWMKVVRKAWVERTLPQKNYRSNAKVCKTCPLQKICNEAGPGEIKIKSLEELSEVV